MTDNFNTNQMFEIEHPLVGIEDPLVVMERQIMHLENQQ